MPDHEPRPDTPDGERTQPVPRGQARPPQEDPEPRQLGSWDDDAPLSSGWTSTRRDDEASYPPPRAHRRVAASHPAAPTRPVYSPGVDDQAYGDQVYDEQGYGVGETQVMPPAAPSARADRQHEPRRPAPEDPGPRRARRRPAPASVPPRRPVGRDVDEPRAPRPRRRRRPLRLVTLVVLLLIAGYVAWMWIAVGNVWDARGTVAAQPTSAGRPPAGEGKNVLIVGSDGRNAKGGTTGKTQVGGTRTDTIMLMHVPDSGDPTLVSIPRDSYVTVRANRSAPEGKHKINASFSWGGPQLLVDTVEQATKLRIDGYMEVGFGGFQEVVDSVGGVDVCLDKALKIDRKVGVLPAGCQTLDGTTALAYVRMRYNDPLGDIGRAQRQRQVLTALVKKIATPGNVLLPWRVEAVGTPIAQTVTLDQDMTRKDVLDVFLALRDISGGQGTSTVVPVSNLNLTTGDGSSVQWDEEKAARLWDALRNDDPVPADVVAKVPGRK